MEARDELVASAAELRFEAIYFGVLAVLGASVYLVRFGAGGGEIATGLVAAGAAGAVVFALSVRRRVPRAAVEPVPDALTVSSGRARSDVATRMLPLLMLAALLTVAADRPPAALAAGCLTGVAAAALSGFVLVRRWERRTGLRAVHGGGRVYARARQLP